MPTAIVRIQTVEAFVIAADGRVRKTENGKTSVIQNNMQKIYPIPGESLVYALYGNMQLGKDETDKGDFVVDLISEVATAANGLVGKRFEDVTQYAEQLADPILKRLSEAKNQGEILRFPARPIHIEKGLPGYLIGHVFIFGYYNEQPCEIDIRFFHRNHEPDKQVIPRDLWLGYNPEIWGSFTVAQLLYDSGEGIFFAGYRRTKPAKPEDLTIEEAIEVAKNYILACDSDTGRGLDPQLCPGIGGRIHIAIIKPDGVTWTKGYEPLLYATSASPHI